MIDSIINGFLSSDFEEQDKASDKLDEVSKNLTLKQGIALLEAAALSFPPRRYDFQDTSSDLIYAVSKTFNEKYVDIINKNFEKYSDKSKLRALKMLTEIPTREAASSFIELMKMYARKIDFSFFRLSIPDEETNIADIFFPAILEFLDIPKIRFEILLFLLNYLQDGKINISFISSYAKIIEEDYKKIETNIKHSSKNWKFMDVGRRIS
jgi:hypothetical protein